MGVTIRPSVLTRFMVKVIPLQLHCCFTLQREALNHILPSSDCSTEELLSSCIFLSHYLTVEENDQCQCNYRIYDICLVILMMMVLLVMKFLPSEATWQLKDILFR